jgi:hypothetical protein
MQQRLAKGAEGQDQTHEHHGGEDDAEDEDQSFEQHRGAAQQRGRLRSRGIGAVGKEEPEAEASEKERSDEGTHAPNIVYLLLGPPAGV